MEITVTAPVDGVIISLAETGDPVFASGALGAGVAIQPESAEVVAPLAGIIATAMPHAYGIRSDEGVEVLVHVGIETVQLAGRHFVPAVSLGDRVEVGATLVRADFDEIAREGYITATVVLVTNTSAMTSVQQSGVGAVRSGASLLTVEV